MPFSQVCNINLCIFILMIWEFEHQVATIDSPSCCNITGMVSVFKLCSTYIHWAPAFTLLWYSHNPVPWWEIVHSSPRRESVRPSLGYGLCLDPICPAFISFHFFFIPPLVVLVDPPAHSSSTAGSAASLIALLSGAVGGFSAVVPLQGNSFACCFPLLVPWRPTCTTWFCPSQLKV